jgi:hypothetical protein
MKPSVLIGYSACQLTREAFERAGCDAWTCDLLPARGNGEKHIQGDVWGPLRSRGWDFAVLHPMCTYLTVSAAWAYGDGPYHQKVKPGTLVGAERRHARADALGNFLALLEFPFPVAVENPATSFVNKAIRPPDQIVQPWQFGDDASKATGLWLTRGTPKLRLDQSKAVAPRIVHGKPRWSNQTDSGQNNMTPSGNRWLERSKTYPGIAEAMGSQWGRWLMGREA